MRNGDGKRCLSLNIYRLKRIAGISIAFCVAWAAYFSVFHDIRLLRGVSPDDWYYVFQYLPLVLAATVRYGLIVPLILSVTYGALSYRMRWGLFFLDLAILIIVFLVPTVGFEFAFEHHQVAMWKFYLLFFPPFCAVGALVGRIVRKLVSIF